MHDLRFSRHLLPALFLLMSAISGCAASPLDRLSPEQMETSLDLVERSVRSAHAGSLHGLSDSAEAGLKNARQSIRKPQSAESFYFALNRFLKNLNDAHTVVRLKEADTEAGIIEQEHIFLPAYWNENGIFLTEDSPGFTRGERILRVGSLDEAALLARLGDVIPAENIGYLKAKAASLLGRADYLGMLGVVNAHNSINFEVMAADGSVRQTNIPLVTTPSVPGKSNNGRYQIWSQESLAVFQFDRFDYNEELVLSMENFFEQVKEQRIQKVAVDLRNNPGGDSSVAFAFLEHFSDITYHSFSVDIRFSAELGKMAPYFTIATMNPTLAQLGLPLIPEQASHYLLNQDLVKQQVLSRLTIKPPQDMIKVSGKQLYVLTNALTFSSGNLFTILVKDNRLGQVIGEPTGNRVNFNGSEIRLDIPYTQFYLNLSTAQMIRPDSSKGDADSIVPDVFIPLSPNDVIQGRDPLIEYLKTQ